MHRLWSHRSFKARWPLRLVLVVFWTMTMQGSLFSYCRDHRTHHKWSDTVADPEDSSQGCFFAHMGWRFLKKNPNVIEYGKKLNHDDMWNDPIVRFHHKWNIELVFVFSFLLPTLIPVLLWSEDPLTSFFMCVCVRIVVVWQMFWTVNSIAHVSGQRLYHKDIVPADNRLVNYLSLGEGEHNFHHAFPV